MVSLEDVIWYLTCGSCMMIGGRHLWPEDHFTTILGIPESDAALDKTTPCGRVALFYTFLYGVNKFSFGVANLFASEEHRRSYRSMLVVLPNVGVLTALYYRFGVWPDSVRYHDFSTNLETGVNSAIIVLNVLRLYLAQTRGKKDKSG